MHAVIVDVSINEVQDAQRELTEQVIPTVSRAPGFVAGYWMAVGEGKGHSVAIFESEEAAQEVAEVARAGAPEAVTVEGVQLAQVIVSA